MGRVDRAVSKVRRAYGRLRQWRGGDSKRQPLLGSSVTAAVQIVLLARSGIDTAEVNTSIGTRKLSWWLWLGSILRPWWGLLRYIYLGLGVVEIPSWCLSGVSFSADLADARPCGSSTTVWRTSPDLLSFETSSIIEIVCLSLFLLRACMRAWSSGRRALSVHSYHYWQRFHVLLVVLALADSILSFQHRLFTVPFGVIGYRRGVLPGNFQLCRLARPLVFLSASKTVRNLALLQLQTMAACKWIIVTLLSSVALSAWLGIVIFAGSSEGHGDFSSASAALGSMWTLMVTANFPDVMLPAYNDLRVSFLFFGGFLTLTRIILMSTLIAEVYATYKSLLATHFFNERRTRRAALHHAFNLLAGDSGVLDRDTFMRFLRACDRAWRSRAGREFADKLFDMVDSSHDGVLQEAEFVGFAEHAVAHPSDYFLKHLAEHARHFEGTRLACWERLWLSSFVASLVNLVVVLGTVASVYQTAMYLESVESGGEPGDEAWPRWSKGSWLYWTQVGFSAFYVLHLLCRLSVMGFRSFWRHSRHALLHRFDTVSVLLLAAAEIFYALAAAPHATLALRCLGAARVLRSVRLLWLVPQIRELISVLFDLLFLFGTSVEILFVLFYLYAEVGVELYGGLINTKADQFADTDFGTSTGGYWAMNMNDILSAMVTLFALMIGNNFQVLTSGLVLALSEASELRPAAFIDPTGRVAALFAVSFYVMTNFGSLNLLCALVIDAFSVIKEGTHDRLEGGRGLHQSKDLVLAKVLKSAVSCPPDGERGGDLPSSRTDSWIERRLKRWGSSQRSCDRLFSEAAQ